MRDWSALSMLALAGGLLLCLPAPSVRADSFEDGIGYFEGSHYRWALEKFVEAVDQSPRDPRRWWYLAEAYRLLGDVAAAAPAYRRVLQITPESPLAAAARQALEGMDQPSVATTRIPFQRRGSLALLSARINGQEAGSLILDTGASLVALSATAAARLGIRPAGTASVRLATANGTIQAPLVILESIEIGGTIALHVPAVIHEFPGMPPEIAGLLGMSFLDRFQVNLDITAGSLILEAGR